MHIAAECSPFAKTGGLADAVIGLANAQAAAGHDVFVCLPRYAGMQMAGKAQIAAAPPITISLGERVQTVRFLRGAKARRRPTIVFVDMPGAFDRRGIYGENFADYPDNHIRFALLSLATVRRIPDLAPRCTIIHAHDWHTALVPWLLRTDPEAAARMPDVSSVFSVHNVGYQGRFPMHCAADLGLTPEAHPEAFAYGQLNLMRLALAHSDEVVTVSPSHSHELRTEMGGHGLHRDFTALGERLWGIRNGIDCAAWDPAHDPHIPATYSAADLSGKDRCKAELQLAMRLEVDARVPLCAMSARFVEQKGLDLVLASREVREGTAQFAFLGHGEPRYHTALAALAEGRAGRIAVEFGFEDVLEHRLLAGADILLMPSLYEPCGLTQMRAQRYGALPVARNVGGLRDTVVDERTGFMFDSYDAGAFDGAMGRALGRYADPNAWDALRRIAMGTACAWEPAAIAYAIVYQAAAARRLPRLATAPA